MEINSSVQLLDTYEVADILGISRSSVYQLTKEGLLGYVKVLRSKKMFTPELVSQFIRSQTVQGGPARSEINNRLWLVE